MTLKEKAEEIIRLSKEAMAAPWKCVFDNQEYRIEGEITPRKAIGDSIVSINEEQKGTMGVICCCAYPEVEGQLIAYSRNNCEQIARGLLKAMEALDDIVNKDLDYRYDAGMHLQNKIVMARNALREIESLKMPGNKI